jgi:hypothetical protein
MKFVRRSQEEGPVSDCLRKGVGSAGTGATGGLREFHLMISLNFEALSRHLRQEDDYVKAAFYNGIPGAAQTSYLVSASCACAPQCAL